MSDSSFSGKPLTGAAQPDAGQWTGFASGYRVIVMSDQEIRARALECSARLYETRDSTERDVIATAVQFEHYIRNGKDDD